MDPAALRKDPVAQMRGRCPHLPWRGVLPQQICAPAGSQPRHRGAPAPPVRHYAPPLHGFLDGRGGVATAERKLPVSVRASQVRRGIAHTVLAQTMTAPSKTGRAQSQGRLLAVTKDDSRRGKSRPSSRDPNGYAHPGPCAIVVPAAPAAARLRHPRAWLSMYCRASA